MTYSKKFHDVRDATHQSRIGIGFLPDFHMWKDQKATFTDEELIIHGHPVMERWEDNYMCELASIAASQGGDVLEVGFGLGISAHYIQTHAAINTHIVIEANADVYDELLRFAQGSTHPVKPMLGFWQEVSSLIPDGSITGILFDTYPLTTEEIHQNHFTFFAEAYRLLRPGGVLTYYSDEIDSFGEVHLEKLHEAGFTDIEKRLCFVAPPLDCKYWKSNTILAPIITK